MHLEIGGPVACAGWLLSQVSISIQKGFTSGQAMSNQVPPICLPKEINLPLKSNE